MSPQPVKDLSGLWSYVRDQGMRPTCLAHAASDVHMVAHGLTDALSAESLLHDALAYMKGIKTNGAITVPAAKKALKNDGQPLESEWPYNRDKAGRQIGPCTSRWHGVMTSFNNHRDIEIHVANGVPVLLIIRLTDSFHFLKAPWVISEKGFGSAIHAVVAAGIGRAANDGESFILIRNSWGLKWGDKGHAWLSTRYLQDKLIEWCLLASTTH